MKKNFLLAFTISISVAATAQNEPELIGELQNVDFMTLRLAYIDHGLPKLIKEGEEVMDIYNMDFSLFQSIEYPEADSNSFGRRFVTRSLFDCDSTDIEYMSTGGTAENPFVRIFNDDGSVLFELDGYSFFFAPTFTEIERRFVSDENGSYAMFSQGVSSEGGILMYQFCGQLPQALARESDGSIFSGIMEQENNGFDTYPNPAREIIKFEYDLQGHGKANLQLFNTSGQVIKEMMLGDAFEFIRLNISDLEQGTYIARITTDDGFELSEKFVKVK